MAGLKLNINTASQSASASKSTSTSARTATIPAQAGPSSGTVSAASQPSSSSLPSSSTPQQSYPRPRQPQLQTQQPIPPPAQTQTQPQNVAQPQTDLDAPPHSPITPPLQPLKSTTPIPLPTIPPNFASLGGRAPLTHNSHPATVPSAPPPPVPLEPIDFEDNVDVIALRTAISILQMQKRKAEADIRQLRDVKNAAAADPKAFYKDLMEDRVGKGLPGDGRAGEEDDSDDSDSDSDDSHMEEDDLKDVKMEDGTDGDEFNASHALKPSLMEGKTSSEKGKATAASTTSGNNGIGGSRSSSNRNSAAAPPWTAKFPEKQELYRCPPINWSQYAVEGEALDRLHHEQQTRPTLGTPAILGANGTFEFTGVPNPDDGKKIEGIAAPFDPFRDKLLTKPKGGGGPSRRGA